MCTVFTYWHDLFAELRGEIRSSLEKDEKDAGTRRMLALTCKHEAACPMPATVLSLREGLAAGGNLRLLRRVLGQLHVTPDFIRGRGVPVCYAFARYAVLHGHHALVTWFIRKGYVGYDLVDAIACVNDWSMATELLSTSSNGGNTWLVGLLSLACLRHNNVAMLKNMHHVHWNLDIPRFDYANVGWKADHTMMDAFSWLDSTIFRMDAAVFIIYDMIRSVLAEEWDWARFSARFDVSRIIHVNGRCTPLMLATKHRNVSIARGFVAHALFDGLVVQEIFESAEEEEAYDPADAKKMDLATFRQLVLAEQ